MRLYVETLVVSAYVDQRTPERLKATRAFWPLLNAHEPILSTLTMEEMAQAEYALSEQMQAEVSMFDIEKVKQESGLPADVLARLEELVRAEFRDDPMMFELHLVRVIQSIQDGSLTVEEALAENVAV